VKNYQSEYSYIVCDYSHLPNITKGKIYRCFRNSENNLVFEDDDGGLIPAVDCTYGFASSRKYQFSFV